MSEKDIDEKAESYKHKIEIQVLNVLQSMNEDMKNFDYLNF
jgi:hypothetical protein